MHRIKWLLVEWENRPNESLYGLVHIRSLVDPSKELHTGKLVFVADGNGEVRRAKVVMSSDDRRFLEEQLLAMEEHGQITFGAFTPSPIPVRSRHLKSNYYSASASSWSQNESQSEIDSEISQLSYSTKRKNVHRMISRIKSNKSSRPHYKHAASSSGRHGPKIRKSQPIKYEQRTQYKSRHSKISTTPYPKSNEDSSVITYNQGSQTEGKFNTKGIEKILPNIDEKVLMLERVIYEMEEKFSILEATVDSWSPHTNESGKESPEIEMTLQELSINKLHHDHGPQVEHVKQRHSVRVKNFKTRESTPEEQSDNEDLTFNDMMVIGTSGKTLVPRHIINQIDWNSYTMATRKLLMAVFPRRTLATHSLTGKSSPAFMNKPAKLCLDPVKVNDIVAMVTTNCNVKESLVRSAITTKCADENKMFRMRQEKFVKRQKIETETRNNQENIVASLLPDNQNS